MPSEERWFGPRQEEHCHNGRCGRSNPKYTQHANRILRVAKLVLSKEKKSGINEIESKLSSFTWRTNDFEKYTDYLHAKERVDRLTRQF